MKKGYKYRLSVNNKQSKLLKDLMFSVNQIYNIIQEAIRKYNEETQRIYL